MTNWDAVELYAVFVVTVIITGWLVGKFENRNKGRKE